jgi:hypothetical protein
LNDNRVTAEPASKAELESLRSIVTRSLKDVGAPGLSADTRLVLAYPAFGALSAYFDGCRMKRNDCEYDFAGRVSDTDADSLLKTVKQFVADAEAWAKARHPHLI